MRYLAPAKLNRFLHIVGRRADGYHELQTIFQRINYNDTLEFRLRKDNQIQFELKIDLDAIKPPANHLMNGTNSVVQAATLLRSFAERDEKGVDIILTKKIPVGAGLGGGSSDAATTLTALNQLWALDLSKMQLASIGLQIGADVPFFIFEQSAWGVGVGEKLTPITLPSSWFLVIVPEVSIATIDIFRNPELKRDTAIVEPDLTLLETGHNDCEPIARRLYPEVEEVMNILSKWVKPRMTGTGSCVFAVFETEEAAHSLAAQLPSSLRYFVAESLD
jgi:4-diphosphocytidyl-2-C-methyl-D-erythritol kinase